jgi:hypothetical protein
MTTYCTGQTFFSSTGQVVTCQRRTDCHAYAAYVQIPQGFGFGESDQIEPIYTVTNQAVAAHADCAIRGQKVTPPRRSKSAALPGASALGAF